MQTARIPVGNMRYRYTWYLVCHIGHHRTDQERICPLKHLPGTYIRPVCQSVDLQTYERADSAADYLVQYEQVRYRALGNWCTEDYQAARTAAAPVHQLTREQEARRGETGVPAATQHSAEQ